jgi:hypothetical protein
MFVYLDSAVVARFIDESPMEDRCRRQESSVARLTSNIRIEGDDL